MSPARFSLALRAMLCGLQGCTILVPWWHRDSIFGTLPELFVQSSACHWQWDASWIQDRYLPQARCTSYSHPYFCHFTLKKPNKRVAIAHLCLAAPLTRCSWGLLWVSLLLWLLLLQLCRNCGVYECVGWVWPAGVGARVTAFTAIHVSGEYL